MTEVTIADETKVQNLPPSVEREVSFGKDVLPILRHSCFDCHKGSNPDSGVRLDYHAKLLGESDGVPLLLIGRSEASRLIEVIAGKDPEKQMPPEDYGERLSDEEIGILRAWIDQGAKWDEELLPNPNQLAAQKHWAFQPLQRPQVPKSEFLVKTHGNDKASGILTKNPIDAFVAQLHREKEVFASPNADQRTLIRRLYLVLHGMPPTEKQLAEYLNANVSWGETINKVMDSPHYGERMARHWLDSARWAESEGYAQNNPRPHAWRYRDYVINSFNRDTSYAHFLTQQIAGDEMEPYLDENIVATGFLAAARISADDLHFYRAENDMYTDIVSTLSRSVLGLTLGCARCHDHKFDPITQRDFYRLKAFFTKGFPGNLVLKDSEPPESIAQIATELLDFDLQVRKRVLSTGFEEEPQAIRDLLNSTESERTLEQEREFRPHRTRMNIQIAGCNSFRIMDDEQKRLEELRGQLNEIINDTSQTWGFYSPVTSPHQISTLPMLGNFPLIHDKARFLDQRDYLLARGQIFETVATVTPGWPEAFGPSPKIKVNEKSRTILANWLVSNENPLTARVWANRIWQMHFGQGLVETPGNFGIQGSKPSHPELLDWLAIELINNNWSTKHLHQLIVSSQTWRQRANFRISDKPRVSQTLLTAWPRRRLEAEAIRDSLLVASGELQREIGGVSIPTSQEIDNLRRAMYLFQERDKPPQLQELFDGPTSLSEACLQRQVSTSALQSLYLLNNRFAQDRSLALAAKIKTIAGNDLHQQAKVGFNFVLGRSPDEHELETSIEFLKQFQVNEAEYLANQSDVTYTPTSKKLALWLRADKGVKNSRALDASSNEKVAEWIDQSPANIQKLDPLRQNEDTRQPQLISNRLNGMGGLPVVRFQGGEFGKADHVLEVADAAVLRATNAYTVCMTLRFNGKGNRNEAIFVKGRNGDKDIASFALLRFAADGKFGLDQNINGQWSGRLKTANAIPDNTPLLIIARWKAERLELKIVKQGEVLADLSTILTGEIDSGIGGPLSIGGYTQAFSEKGERMNGDIGELLYFTEGVDDNELVKLTSYLERRWLNNHSTQLTALELYSQALLNLNEFVYIE